MLSVTADKATKKKLLTFVVPLSGNMDELSSRRCFRFEEEAPVQLRVTTTLAALNGCKRRFKVSVREPEFIQ